MGKESLTVHESRPYSFGVSEFTTWPWTFEEDVDTYTALGVDAIEVCEFKLDEDRIQGQLSRIETSGLHISSVQPAVRTLFPSQSQPEPKEVCQRMALFRQSIERFGDFARGVPFVTNAGIPPNGNIQAVMDVAAREYKELADFAAGKNVRIAFEPLNAAIMNVESAIWTLEQAMGIVSSVDRPNFGICLDIWNVWQNAGIVEAIKACGERIFVVQVSDWRTPRSFQDRFIPGQGEIPLPTFLQAVHQSGFRGSYIVEIFSGDVPDSLWKSDLKEVIRQSHSGLDRAWEEAFAG